MYLATFTLPIIHLPPLPTPPPRPPCCPLLPTASSPTPYLSVDMPNRPRKRQFGEAWGRRMIKTMCARDSKTWFPDTVHCWQPSVDRVVLLFDKWAIWLRVSKRSEMGWDQWEERELQLSLILFSLLPTRCNHSPSRLALFSHVIGLFCFQIALSK